MFIIIVAQPRPARQHFPVSSVFVAYRQPGLVLSEDKEGPYKSGRCIYTRIVNHHNQHTMPKYGKKASEKVEKVMHELHEGTLKSGSGKKVTSKKQAIAIGLSEAREAGGKVPKAPVKKKAAAKKKK